MRLFTITFFVCSFLLSQAQPTITNSIAPEIGDTYTINYLDNVNLDPGPAGANQNWDFGDLPQDFEFHYNFIAPADAPGNENFPDADCVWQFVEFESYNYYKKTDDAIVTVGGVNGDPDFINFLLIYHDDTEAMQLPLTYNSTYNYVSTFDEYLFGNYIGTYTRTSSLLVDAYGTLTTPNGTYEDVLRIKIEYDDQLGIDYTQYAWFDTEDFIPLLQYEVSTDPEQPAYAVITRNNNTTTATDRILDNKLTIQHANHANGKEHFIVESDRAYQNLDLRIYDTQMQLVHRSRIDRVDEGNTQIQLDLNLASTMYVVELVGEQYRTAARFYKP